MNFFYITGGQISLGILITLIVMTCLVIATGMGLYGIKEVIRDTTINLVEKKSILILNA